MLFKLIWGSVNFPYCKNKIIMRTLVVDTQLQYWALSSTIAFNFFQKCIQLILQHTRCQWWVFLFSFVYVEHLSVLLKFQVQEIQNTCSAFFSLNIFFLIIARWLLKVPQDSCGLMNGVLFFFFFFSLCNFVLGVFVICLLPAFQHVLLC